VGFPLLSADEQAHLVDGIRSGDRAAEGRLVEHFSRAIRLMARVRARELGEDDLTQEVLIAAITALRRGQLRDTERLAQFVSGVARNVINNRLRRARGPVHEPIDEHDQPAPVADLTQELARRERAAALRRALEGLSADDRRILRLTLVDGLKPAEIAERLGLGEEVVRTRKSRAIKRLKERVTNGQARTTSNRGPEP
jgi:RNA polymerase sigma factor (sigma-70 family)